MNIKNLKYNSPVPGGIDSWIEDEMRTGMFELLLLEKQAETTAPCESECEQCDTCSEYVGAHVAAERKRSSMMAQYRASTGADEQYNYIQNFNHDYSWLEYNFDRYTYDTKGN